MTKPLRISKSFDKLVEDFEERERFWKKKLPRKALERLPKRTHRHDDVGNAYHYLSYAAFRGGRFGKAGHYFELQEELHRRHQHDDDLEGYERESYAERLDRAGWISGDWERFERYVALSPPQFKNAAVAGHINLYVDWAILGQRVGAELVLDDLEPAAERERQQIAEDAKPPTLGVVQSLWADDGLARAYFWLGDWRKCREVADRYLAAVEAWKGIKTKPRHIQLGHLAAPRELVSALRVLSGESEDEFRSPAASRHLVKHLVFSRKDPASYSFEASLLLLMAVAAADRKHPHVTGFLDTFPHLRHLLERRE